MPNLNDVLQVFVPPPVPPFPPRYRYFIMELAISLSLNP